MYVFILSKNKLYYLLSEKLKSMEIQTTLGFNNKPLGSALEFIIESIEGLFVKKWFYHGSAYISFITECVFILKLLME